MTLPDPSPMMGHSSRPPLVRDFFYLKRNEAGEIDALAVAIDASAGDDGRSWDDHNTDGYSNRDKARHKEPEQHNTV